MLLDAPPPPPSRGPLILGLCLGVLAGVAGGAFAFELPLVIAARTTPIECADEAALEARIAALEAGLEAQGRGDEVAASRRRADEGTPLGWPDDAPDADREPIVREAAKIVAKEYAATLNRVDCAEYPCIATFVHRGGRKLDEAAISTWARRIDRALVGDADRFVRTSVTDSAPVHTLAVTTRELGPLERVRVKHRVREQDRQAVAEQYVPQEGF